MTLHKRYIYAAGAALLLGLGFLSFSPPSQAEGETITILPDYSSCVRLYNGPSSSSQQSMRFYNGCPTRLYFKACVKDTMGEVKLYTSSNSVSTNGNWTIYTFPGVDPSHFVWVAAPYIPPTPDLCK